MFGCQFTGFRQFTNLARHLCVKPAAFCTRRRAIHSSILSYTFRAMEFGLNPNTETSYQLLLAGRAFMFNRFFVNGRELPHVSAQKLILESRLQLGNLFLGTSINASPSEVRWYRRSLYRSSVENRCAGVVAQLYVPFPEMPRFCFLAPNPSDLSLTKLTKMLKMNDRLEVIRCRAASRKWTT